MFMGSLWFILKPDFPPLSHMLLTMLRIKAASNAGGLAPHHTWVDARAIHNAYLPVESDIRLSLTNLNFAPKSGNLIFLAGLKAFACLFHSQA